MSMQYVTGEIGILGLADNISRVSDSESVIERYSSILPLPPASPDGIGEQTDRFAEWISGFGKTKIMMTSSEIDLAAKLAEATGEDTEIIITLPSNMEAESRERLKNNLPFRSRVHTLEENSFPEIYPENGMIVTFGYCAGGRTMIMDDTFRVVNHYSDFYGIKAFIPYIELDTALRCVGWREIDRRNFNTIWRNRQ